MPTLPDNQPTGQSDHPRGSAIAARAEKSLRIVGHWFPLLDPGPLAEPWRRLLAAALDVLVIAVVHLVAMGWLYGTGRNADTYPVLWRVISPLFCWAYVLVGWSTGATPGMRCVEIRLARVDGRRIWVDTAVVRIVGFVFASIPAKLGLVPILSDSLRQGWHDRIAGTIVVKRDAAIAAVPVREPSSRRFVMRPPDVSAPREGWPVVLAAYVALAVLLTWPVALHFGDRLAGTDGDKYVFAWNLWFVQTALARHWPLLSTNLLFTPHTAPLVFHTMDWFDCFLSIPLTHIFGLVVAYNILLLGSLVASAFSAYWLVGSLTRSRGAAAVAGVIFGFSPFFLAQALGHLNVAGAEFLPLFALLFYGAATAGKTRGALGAGIALALAGYCDLQYLLFGALVAFAIVVARLQSDTPATAVNLRTSDLLPCSGRKGHRLPSGKDKASASRSYSCVRMAHLPRVRTQPFSSRFGEAARALGELPEGPFGKGRSGLVRSCMVTFAAVAILLGPLLLPAMRASTAGGYMNKSSASGAFSADIADYGSLSPLSSLGRGRTHGTTLANLNVERIVTPGLAALLIGVLGLWRSRRQTLPWRIGLIAAGLLSFGPVLTLWELSASTLATVFLLGFPGMGFATPWNTSALVGYIETLLANPREWLSASHPVAMPEALVSAVVPMMPAFRTPSRLAMIVSLCLAVGVGYALREGIALLRARPIWRPVLLAAAAVLILGEYVAVPYPTPTVRLSMYDWVMGKDPTDYAVIDVPFNASGQYQFAQTIHHKRLFRGFLARVPTETRSLCRSNDLLFYLDGFPALPRTRVPHLAAGLTQLQRLGARYILIHRAQVSAARRVQLDALFVRLRCRSVWRDREVDVYIVPNPPCAPTTARPFWRGVGKAAGGL